MSNHQKGLFAETLAIFYLRCKGYRLLARRFKTKLGEIDIIMQRGKTLAFIEVKARPSNANGLEAISPKARQRIQRSAQLFCQSQPRFNNHDWRFDAIVVKPRRLPYHLKDAWRPL